jgi:hypothetical protein
MRWRGFQVKVVNNEIYFSVFVIEKNCNGTFYVGLEPIKSKNASKLKLSWFYMFLLVVVENIFVESFLDNAN